MQNNKVKFIRIGLGIYEGNRLVITVWQEWPDDTLEENESCRECWDRLIPLKNKTRLEAEQRADKLCKYMNKYG